MDYFDESLKLHEKFNGKLEVISKVKIKNKKDLSIAYSPGVARPCEEIAKDKKKFKTLTSAGKTIAVISDGSAVLGLGNIGAKAAMPVMEGKAVLFKRFADLDSIPIVLETQDAEEIINTIKNISSSFAGINLEDISAPRCFEIENRLKEELDIPVFHDDQHGTAIVVLAGIINSLRLLKKDKHSKIVINGSGSAGIAITRLLVKYGFDNIVICDSKGIISKDRKDLNDQKKDLLKYTNIMNETGSVYNAINCADVFIGVSKANLLKKDDVKSMNRDPCIFAMANPIPEIMPDIAKKAGAKIVATGRSDFPNQLNNVLVFPGIFKGAIESGAKQITEDMKIAAAVALADLVKKPSCEKIIPSPFDKNIAKTIAKAVIDEHKKNK